jgi:hypothetical protein
MLQAGSSANDGTVTVRSRFGLKAFATPQLAGPGFYVGTGPGRLASMQARGDSRNP